MKQFLNKDETVLDVKKQLDLPNEFYRINKDTVWKFFLSGNGKYVRAYMHSSVREAFKAVSYTHLLFKLGTRCPVLILQAHITHPVSYPHLDVYKRQFLHTAN